MKPSELLEAIGQDFFTGVPDSLLGNLCDFIMSRYGIDSSHHIIAANEGNSVAIATGYYLATGKIPVVYLQNSGIGNIINPVTSLVNKKIYDIPMIFIVGHRGENGENDEPQHLFCGLITEELIRTVGLHVMPVDANTRVAEIKNKINELKNGKISQLALVVKKGAIEREVKCTYANEYTLTREEIIEEILSFSEKDVVVSTTGKASRELFFLREKLNDTHECDFLTVGSMGHSSSIALGIALNKKEKRVWCIDGDGAVIMHLGAMSTIGQIAPKNMIHIVINNESHESVGGLPTSQAKNFDIVKIAGGCGYPYAVSVSNIDELRRELSLAKERRELSLIEVKAKIYSREDLGRPTLTTYENKKNFMEFLKQ